MNRYQDMNAPFYLQRDARRTMNATARESARLITNQPYDVVETARMPYNQIIVHGIDDHVLNCAAEKEKECCCCDDSLQPSLTSSSSTGSSLSSSLTSFCSIDDHSSSSTTSDASCFLSSRQSHAEEETLHASISKKRSVSIFHTVEVREYDVTVGEHPFCSDGLALTLDWHYHGPTHRSIDESRERTSCYQVPRRLSYMERKNRIFAARKDKAAEEAKTGPKAPDSPSSITTKEDIQAVIENLKKSWEEERTKILSSTVPLLFSNVGGRQGKKSKRRSGGVGNIHRKKPYKNFHPMVMHWKRVLEPTTFFIE